MGSNWLSYFNAAQPQKELFKMKNTFRLIGIIALLAIIGLSMAACSSDDSGGKVVVTLQHVNQPPYYNIVKISDLPSAGFAPSDFKVTINGKVCGPPYENSKQPSVTSIWLYLSNTPLEIGKVYNVRIDYTGNNAGKNSSVAARFPFARQLKCE